MSRKVVTDRGEVSSARFLVVLEKEVPGVGTIRATGEGTTEAAAEADAIDALNIQAADEKTKTRVREQEASEKIDRLIRRWLDHADEYAAAWKRYDGSDEHIQKMRALKSANFPPRPDDRSDSSADRSAPRNPARASGVRRVPRHGARG